MSSKNPSPAATPEDPGSERSILTDLKSGGEQSVMPDLGGINPSAAKSKYKVHSQTLVIALVLAASGAALYTMRKQGMGSGIVFKPLDVKYELDKKKRPANEAQEKRILSELERSQDPLQGLLEKIPKNPFQLDSQAAVTQGGGPVIDSEAIGKALKEQQEKERLDHIRTAIASVEVNAIMEGPIPLARINGKIAREGDMVAEVLKLKAIHDRSVELEADGKLFVVNMNENPQGKTRMPAPRR